MALTRVSRDHANSLRSLIAISIVVLGAASKNAAAQNTPAVEITGGIAGYHLSTPESEHGWFIDGAASVNRVLAIAATYEQFNNDKPFNERFIFGKAPFTTIYAFTATPHSTSSSVLIGPRVYARSRRTAFFVDGMMAFMRNTTTATLTPGGEMFREYYEGTWSGTGLSVRGGFSARLTSRIGVSGSLGARFIEARPIRRYVQGAPPEPEGGPQMTGYLGASVFLGRR